MRQSDPDDERYCLSCLKKMDGLDSLQDLIFFHSCICQECRQKVEPLYESYRKDGLTIHILFRENEFLSSLFHLYVHNQDRALARFFLEVCDPVFVRRIRRRNICLLPVPDERLLATGWDPLSEIFRSCSCPVFYPYYIKGNGEKFALKNHLRLPEKRILAAWNPDSWEVCRQACTLADLSEILWIMADDSWIQDNCNFRIRNRFFRK